MALLGAEKTSFLTTSSVIGETFSLASLHLQKVCQFPKKILSNSMTPRLKAGRLDWGMNAAFKAQAITQPDDYPAEDLRLFFLALSPKP